MFFLYLGLPLCGIGMSCKDFTSSVISQLPVGDMTDAENAFINLDMVNLQSAATT